MLGPFGSCRRARCAHLELRSRTPSGLVWTRVACDQPREVPKVYAGMERAMKPDWTSVPKGVRVRMSCGSSRVVRATRSAMPRAPHWLQPPRHGLSSGEGPLQEHNNVLELCMRVAILTLPSKNSRC